MMFMLVYMYSTRRKALYKHIFQKVDKDRDNSITFKVCILYMSCAVVCLEMCSKNQQNLVTVSLEVVS